MATVKEYAYYPKGQKLAVIEKDTAFDNDPNAKDYGPGADHAHWKSPLSTVTDGLEIEYTHAPTYRINDLDDTVTIDSYRENSGYLEITDATAAFPTSDSITHIVISGSERWNGLHRVQSLSSSVIQLYTKYNGDTVTESSTLYKDITALTDEDSEIDLPSYLSKALIYYIKAKIAEDAMNIEMKDYFMKEFRKMVEKYDSTRVWGPRIVVSGSHAIR